MCANFGFGALDVLRSPRPALQEQFCRRFGLGTFKRKARRRCRHRAPRSAQKPIQAAHRSVWICERPPGSKPTACPDELPDTPVLPIAGSTRDTVSLFPDSTKPPRVVGTPSYVAARRHPGNHPRGKLCNPRHTRPRTSGAHSSHHQQRYPQENMMNCRYIITQLERIQEANVGAGEWLTIERSSGLEEQLQAIESAISRIRDEMGRRERAVRAAPCH
jgi:hypothetical protein